MECLRLEGVRRKSVDYSQVPQWLNFYQEGVVILAMLAAVALLGQGLTMSPIRWALVGL